VQEFGVLLQENAVRVQEFGVRSQEIAVCVQEFAVLLQEITVRVREFAVLLQEIVDFRQVPAGGLKENRLIFNGLRKIHPKWMLWQPANLEK
jgi:hypothetical protein